MSEEKDSAGIRLSIKVTPGAKRNEITGYKDGVLQVRVTAAPEKGKANQAVINLMAEKLRIRKTSVDIIRGQTSRNKIIIIHGISEEEVSRRIIV